MKYIYAILVCLLLLTSCSKFLEEYSTDKKYVETPEDLDKLMVGEAFMTSVSFSVYSQSTLSNLTETGALAPWLHVMDDDTEPFLLDYVATEQSTPFYMLSAFHNWQPTPNINILNFAWDDVLWRKVYKNIGAINAIIFQGNELLAKLPNDVKIKRTLGEAYFLRAYYYFFLTNVYGAPYRKATASTDEGVPLKVSEKVEDKYFTRDKNEVIYKQIISDLDMAAQNLNGYNPTTKIRVGIGAVKALQSRVYLYTEQYDKVLEAAKGMEDLGYALKDLNTYTANSNFTARSSSETIFTMGSNVIPVTMLNDSVSQWSSDRIASSFKSSDNLIDKYDASDLRRKAFFIQSAKAKAWLPAKYRTWSTFNDTEQVSCLYSFRFAEVILNRAEAMAMMGADGDARNEIQKLRAMRFNSATTAQLPQTNQALVEFIRDERRRELCFEGQRWFDLRRYSVNSKYPLPSTFSIKHPVYSYDPQSKIYTKTGNYVLKSISQDAAGWQVPIPTYAIEFNRGSLTNPLRPLRPVQPL
jgi:hypothetical protein